MVTATMKVNITSTGKVSIESELKDISGTESKEEVDSLFFQLGQNVRRLSDKALNEYGYVNSRL